MVSHPLVRFAKPFGFLNYIRLQMHAFCVLSDSGTLTEEASVLNLPAIALRDTHERPEGMDAGTLVMAGITLARVLDAVKLVTSQHDRQSRAFVEVSGYAVPLVSKIVVRTVLSYTDYVNRTVWQKT